ncbi:MFS general substrate transporter [Pleurotus eryngii]|uniref:MFS general substrate transporter n=1 Tax=Pleurotus eryngii TaxID=5323 RepID=A0A9P5ZP44_PLEER|nr:MFS general substrate transporter [Pleurotus eryngii]
MYPASSSLKVDYTHLEDAASSIGGPRKYGDAALEVWGENIIRDISPEEDRRVLRKIDLWIMPVVLLAYFSQQLDKSSLSYTSVFWIVEQTSASQYSWLSSIVYVAQLIWQPMSSYFLVKFPIVKYLLLTCLFGILVSIHVFMWGVMVASTAGAHNFAGLITARFFLGIFEATVSPCFITVTQMWWRRREQTMRLSMWMAMNSGTGMFCPTATFIGSLLSYGLGHINGRHHPFQASKVFIAYITYCTDRAILCFVLPDLPTMARFLTHEEKIVALERLRANNQGTESKEWKWDHALDPKTYLWFALLFLCALPSGGTGAFGPLIIRKDQRSYISFAFLQVVLKLLSTYVSTKIKLKWPVVFFLTLPPIAGASALYTLGRGPELKGALLGCHYVACHTKKLCTTGVVFVAQCAGDIVGPLLYTTDEKPFYHRGLIANLICWIALALVTLVTAAFPAFRNKQRAARYVPLGNAAAVVVESLEEQPHKLQGAEKVATNE